MVGGKSITTRGWFNVYFPITYFIFQIYFILFSTLVICEILFRHFLTIEYNIVSVWLSPTAELLRHYSPAHDHIYQFLAKRRRLDLLYIFDNLLCIDSLLFLAIFPILMMATAYEVWISRSHIYPRAVNPDVIARLEAVQNRGLIAFLVTSTNPFGRQLFYMFAFVVLALAGVYTGWLYTSSIGIILIEIPIFFGFATLVSVAALSVYLLAMFALLLFRSMKLLDPKEEVQ